MKSTGFIIAIVLLGLFLATGCTNVTAKRKARQEFDRNEIHVYTERMQKPEIEQWFRAYKTDSMPIWFVYGEIQASELLKRMELAPEKPEIENQIESRR